MSPPAKKSASGKSPSKSATAKAASAKAVSGAETKKSAAKKEGGKSASKAAPKKKRSRKKKSGKARALLVAFVAGLLAASVAAWFLRDLRLPELHFPDRAGVEQAAAPSGGEKSADSRAPGRPSKPRAEASAPKQAKSAKNGASVTAPAQVPPQAAAPDRRQSPARSETPQTPPLPPKDAAGLDAAASSAVASALIDLQSLPYEESLHASLDDRIRQVDYALMQAAWMRKLPARALRLVSVEDRLEGVEPYQFQAIDVLPGKNAREFTAAFKECLAAWAEGAVLAESGGNRWSVTVNGVHTHSIRLYPGKTDFPPLPGAPKAAPDARPPEIKSPPPPPGMAPPRVRAKDEPPRLVIVIDDLGASPSALQQLLALDYPVTMAFWPHGAHTKEGARAAHARGREILVHQPMEPLGYPKVRPGPNVLLTGMEEARIRKLVLEGIAAVPHAVGLNNHMGSRFTQDRRGTEAVARLLKERGLFLLDSLTDSRSIFAAQGRRVGLDHYRRNVFLDVEHSRSAVLAALRRAERIAQLSGQAVAIGHPLPETLAALKDWQRLRNKAVRIVRLRDLTQDR